MRRARKARNVVRGWRTTPANTPPLHRCSPFSTMFADGRLRSDALMPTTMHDVTRSQSVFHRSMFAGKRRSAGKLMARPSTMTQHRALTEEHTT